MDDFKKFLSEQSDEQPYKILVISAEPTKEKMFHTAQRVTDEAKKLGHDVYVVKVEGAIVSYENEWRIYNSDDKKGFVIDAHNTVAIVRGSVRLKKSYLDLLSQLEKIGVCMVNSRETVEISADKYRTYLKLQDFGLTQPKTVLIPNKENWKEAVKKLDTTYPMIMKTLEGSKGVGVLFIESERQIESLVQLLYSQNENIDLLLQEYKKTDGDIRVIVLGGKVVASMKRQVVEGDFRSNVSQGAKVQEYPLSELEIEQCLLASKAIDGSWTAVDFIPSKNPKSEPPHILEVNHSPGTEGIEKATKTNIVKMVLEHFSKSKNRYSVANQCGYYETLTVKPFGQLVGKFDTGNSKYSVLHAENLKVVGGRVTFTLHGKTITTKHYGTYISVTGGGDDERYIVKFDMEFAGTLYKGVEFGLDNRERMGTEVLLNRKTMKMLNVMVSPSRKYIVTTKFTLDKEKENDN